MKLMRQLLKDRVSASAIAFLISYFLLLQGVVGAVAQGAMGAAAVDPLNVIFTSMGATVDVNSDGSSQQKQTPDCPCASLCRIASGAMPGIFGEHPSPGIIVTTKTVEGFVETPDRVLSSVQGLIGEARAPPILP